MSIRLFTSCRTCGISSQVFAFGDLSNDEYSVLTCKNGHETKYFTATPDYPLYFDNGIDAYSDRNFFEAYTSTYHAWEQFLYTFVQASFPHFVGTQIASYGEIENMLKPISKNSVQIEGAFNSTYALLFNEKAPQMSNSLKSTRNSIVHGKHNPTEDDVRKCLMAVYDFIKPIEIKLFTGYEGFTDPHRAETNNAASWLEVLSAKRLEFLRSENILEQDEIDSGAAVLVSEGQHMLGMNPNTSSPDLASKTMSFGELVKSRAGIANVTKKLYQLNHTE